MCIYLTTPCRSAVEECIGRFFFATKLHTDKVEVHFAADHSETRHIAMTGLVSFLCYSSVEERYKVMVQAVHHLIVTV